MFLTVKNPLRFLNLHSLLNPGPGFALPPFDLFVGQTSVTSTGSIFDAKPSYLGTVFESSRFADITEFIRDEYFDVVMGNSGAAGRIYRISGSGGFPTEVVIAASLSADDTYTIADCVLNRDGKLDVIQAFLKNTSVPNQVIISN